MKNKTTQALRIKNLLSSSKHDSLKYCGRLKSNVNSHMSIQYVSQSEFTAILIMRQMVSPKKVHVQTTRNFRLQKIAQAFIICHRSGKGHV
jgi:hypothetical protein